MGVVEEKLAELEQKVERHRANIASLEQRILKCQESIEKHRHNIETLEQKKEWLRNPRARGPAPLDPELRDLIQLIAKSGRSVEELRALLGLADTPEDGAPQA